MPAVTGVLETALYVKDVERSTKFYQDLFGFELILSEDRLHALSVADRNVLLLFKEGASTHPSQYPGGLIPPHDGHGTLHLAFAIPCRRFAALARHLAQHSIAIESEVTGERGGHSLYFRDPDGHLVELATPGLWEDLLSGFCGLPKLCSAAPHPDDCVTQNQHVVSSRHGNTLHRGDATVWQSEHV